MDKIKKLEKKIQEEIWRLQMLDYTSPNYSHEQLSKMLNELAILKQE